MKTILVDAVNVFVAKEGKIFQDMYNMLERFPTRKIVLTNADDEGFKRFNLSSVPYEIFTLKHNPEKINPVYYTTMLEHFGLSSEDVVYFEHNEEAVKSAQSVGITTYHYDKDGKDLDALKDFLMEQLA